MHRHDALVVGGGVMGCATALRLAEGGMSVAVLERGALCAAASGVNPGTLSIQIKRAALVPYAMRGWELWRTTSERFGVDVGFHVRGGLTLAFTEAEVALLESRMTPREAAGAPIEFVDGRRARELEPGISDRVLRGSYCPLDAYADASRTGLAYRAALRRAGVEVWERRPVTAIHPDGEGYIVTAGDLAPRAARIVLAAGAWLNDVTCMLGTTFPVHCRVNQVAVTERCSQTVRAVIGHAGGVLTLKQSENGTVLIGGGWQGTGDPATGRTEVVLENLVANLRLAQHVVPALAHARLVRIWHGFEAHVPDFMPLAGPLPEHPQAFVLGCVRGGYTIGPYIGRLLGDLILGYEPEMPLFDPARFCPAPTAGPAAS